VAGVPWARDLNLREGADKADTSRSADTTIADARLPDVIPVKAGIALLFRLRFTWHPTFIDANAAANR